MKYNKKIIKFISNIIPNKRLRHEFREYFNKKNLEFLLNSLEKGELKNKFEEIKLEFPKYLSVEETLKKIIEEKVSISRFGDGEFNLLLENRKAQNIFQKKDKLLQERLEKILKEENEKLLICLMPLEGKEYNQLLKSIEPKFFERYWLENWNELKDRFSNQIIYGNTLVSRINVFEECSLQNIKKIWEGRDVIFVYSMRGRFVKDSRLFDNIKTEEDIEIPPINAFDNYDEILKNCLKKKKESLFLISGGAMATILAYDLSMNGYQALDIGHLPNCYHEFLGEIETPELLPREKGE